MVSLVEGLGRWLLMAIISTAMDYPALLAAAFGCCGSGDYRGQLEVIIHTHHNTNLLFAYYKQLYLFRY